MEKIEKLFYWWVIIILIISLGAISLFFAVGPLLLGLLVDSQLFLLYILTFIFIVPTVCLWGVIPDLIDLL